MAKKGGLSVAVLVGIALVILASIVILNPALFGLASIPVLGSLSEIETRTWIWIALGGAVAAFVLFRLSRG